MGAHAGFGVYVDLQLQTCTAQWLLQRLLMMNVPSHWSLPSTGLQLGDWAERRRHMQISRGASLARRQGVQGIRSAGWAAACQASTYTRGQISVYIDLENATLKRFEPATLNNLFRGIPKLAGTVES